MQPTLTILTPTYNRAKYLQRCYESLSLQTRWDFEWLIVDDGSTDDTEKVVNECLSDKVKRFDIVYVKKTNGGKHTALNFAMKFVKGEIILILDSDDYLLPFAVDEVIKTWEKYRGDKQICGMSFLRGKSSTEPLVIFPNEVERSNHIDFRINKKLNGDCCEVIRTDVMKEFPFPEFAGEKFLGENYLWVKVALKYDTVYVNKIIYISEYLEGGLTKSGRAFRMKNPQGGMKSTQVELNRRICLSRRIKSAILYSCYGFSAKMRIKDIIISSGHPFLVTLFLPAGRWFCYYWQR